MWGGGGRGGRSNNFENLLQQLQGDKVADRKTAKDKLITELQESRRLAFFTKKGAWGSLTRSAIKYTQKELLTKRTKHEDYGTLLFAIVRRAPLEEAGWPLSSQDVDYIVENVICWIKQYPNLRHSSLATLELVLHEAKYCEAISRPKVSVMFDYLTDELVGGEDGRLIMTEETLMQAKALHHLVANYRRELYANVDREKAEIEYLRHVPIVIRFCCYWTSQFGGLDQQRNDKIFVDVAEEILGCLNVCIFKYGVNCVPHLNDRPLGGEDEDEDNNNNNHNNVSTTPLIFGEMALRFALTNYRSLSTLRTTTYLEHFRLQLHLARATCCQPHPWAIDKDHYLTADLEKLFVLARDECVKNAAQRIRGLRLVNTPKNK